MSPRSLTVEIRDGIAVVRLLGPGKGNAMGRGFWREVPVVFRELDADSNVRVVLLRGSGEHFSYGLDLMEMMGELGPHVSGPNSARKRSELGRLIERLQDSFNAVAECRKPVISAIHGWCIGGGLDLIAATDIRLCSAEAKFSLREVKLAIVADIGSLQRLPHIIGEGATRELAFTGKDIDAERAKSIGLVSDVFETPAALFNQAQAMAEEIAANPPLTVQGIKQVMNERTEPQVQAGLRFVAAHNTSFLRTKDFEEAIQAFIEKRTPEFSGE